jgi:PPOX class probable FMN-dependent enzyme
MNDHVLTTKEDVRAHYGEASRLVIEKALPRLDRHALAFIALSPFVIVASADDAGNCDATPRGDAPGFVFAPDDRTLLLPDRTGNRRVDTLLNIAANPHVGLLFLVPGFGETLRVNGRAAITTEPATLALLVAQGKTPTAAIRIDVGEVFFHCAKAMIRSDIWNPEKHQDRASFPSLGRIVADQIAGIDAEAAEASIAEAYRSRLY